MKPESENVTPQANEVPISENAPETEARPAPFSLPTTGRELFFFVLMLIAGFGVFNSLLYGGANLGFAIFTVLMIVGTVVYLLISGIKPSFYSMTLLVLCAVIAAAFGRTNDGLVKFVSYVFMVVGVNLGLCLMVGCNHRNAGTFRSLLDAPGTLLTMGFGKVLPAIGGLFKATLRGKSLWRKGGAFLLGLCVALPLMAVVSSLLTSADAAFSGLLNKIPEVDVWEVFTTCFIGAFFVMVFYARGVGLRHATPYQEKRPRSTRILNPITVNTVLCAIAAVYALYLLSQLAYFMGGFFGILPKNYTLAQYARRGFFEMAFLCGLNLILMACGTFLVRKDGRVNLLTKLLCLFLGITTLFLVCAASAKMWLYINSFGLTRMRVLTQTVMLFLAFVDLVVIVWLFVPKLPYMKFFAVAALVLCALTIWVDVDMVIARHNTEAYLSGKTDTIDVVYLRELSDSAVPYLAKLAKEAPDAQVAEEAQQILTYRVIEIDDFRGWNYASATAKKHLPEKPASNEDAFGEGTPISEV